jgi:hypothetical protein
MEERISCFVVRLKDSLRIGILFLTLLNLDHTAGARDVRVAIADQFETEFGSRCRAGSLNQPPRFPFWLAVLAPVSTLPAVKSLLVALLLALNSYAAQIKDFFSPPARFSSPGAFWLDPPSRSCLLPARVPHYWIATSYTFDRRLQFHRGNCFCCTSLANSDGKVIAG